MKIMNTKPITTQKIMKISEIQITPIKPNNGLVAFASCIIDDSIYLGSIGILTRLDGGYRMTYPTKNVGDKQINLYHPINQETGKFIEEKIVKKYKEVMKKSNVRHDQIGTATKHVYNT